jgi:hypothetical protein
VTSTSLNFTITARGHPALLGTHHTTLEMTKEDHLTARGDCIVGVAANAGCADFPASLKVAIRAGKTIRVRLAAGSMREEFTGHGHPDLALSHPTDIVFRTSSFTCPRTALINCTKAAQNLDRTLISLLKNPTQQLRITLEVVP